MLRSLNIISFVYHEKSNENNNFFHNKVCNKCHIFQSYLKVERDFNSCIIIRALPITSNIPDIKSIFILLIHLNF